MRISLLVAFAGLLLLGPSVAAACSCAPPPAPSVALEGAAVVFEGTVVGTPAAPDGERPMQGLSPVEYRFNVARSWKGDPGMEVRVFTASSSAACGRSYQKGSTYIVYASFYEGEIRDSSCSRTRTIENATEDLAALGEGTVPRRRGGSGAAQDAATEGDPGEVPPNTTPGQVGGDTQAAAVDGRDPAAADAPTTDAPTTDSPEETAVETAEGTQPTGDAAAPAGETAAEEAGDTAADKEIESKKGCSQSPAAPTLSALLLGLGLALPLRRRS